MCSENRELFERTVGVAKHLQVATGTVAKSQWEQPCTGPSRAIGLREPVLWLLRRWHFRTSLAPSPPKHGAHAAHQPEPEGCSSWPQAAQVASAHTAASRPPAARQFLGGFRFGPFAYIRPLTVIPAGHATRPHFPALPAPKMGPRARAPGLGDNLKAPRSSAPLDGRRPHRQPLPVKSR